MAVNNVANFTKQWTKKNLKGMNKEARAELLYQASYPISKFYFEKGWKQENKPTIELLTKIFADEKTFKVLKYMNKQKEIYKMDLGLIPLIMGAITIIEDEELVEDYVKLVRKVLKPRVKEISKKVNMDKDVLYDLLVIYPLQEVVKPQFCGYYADRMLSKLYVLAKEEEITLETKEFKKLFKLLFGKEELSYIAVAALLQRKETINGFNENQLKLWNNVTSFALSVLEDCDKQELEKRLKFYNSRCAYNPNIARRIDLNTLGEDYPKITKVLKKLSKDTSDKQKQKR